jgi:hypothetical protein
MKVGYQKWVDMQMLCATLKEDTTDNKQTGK